MYALSLQLKTDQKPLHNKQVSANQLQGMFYQVLGDHDAREATRLHDFYTPKPFSLRRLSDPSHKTLTGFEFLSLESEAARFAYESFQAVLEKNRRLNLGRSAVYVKQISLRPGGNLAQIFKNAQPMTSVQLHFKSLTSFRKGETVSHLPIPTDIYRRPLLLWEKFYKMPLPQQPYRFDEWLAQAIQVSQFNGRTAHNRKKGRQRFEGFIGSVTLTCGRKWQLDPYQRLWSTLTQILPYSGTGYRTLHGFGSIEINEMIG